jgi:hypothetical protein
MLALVCQTPPLPPPILASCCRDQVSPKILFPEWGGFFERQALRFEFERDSAICLVVDRKGTLLQGIRIVEADCQSEINGCSRLLDLPLWGSDVQSYIGRIFLTPAEGRSHNELLK